MKKLPLSLVVLATFVPLLFAAQRVADQPAAAAPADAAPATPAELTWDAKVKEYHPQRGETEKLFTFDVANASPREITITEVQPSCGCTMVQLPPVPWKLAPGETGRIEAKMDWTGRYGLFSKPIYITTSEGTDTLTLRIHIPKPEKMIELPLARARNLQVALADRQAVFKNDCAKCHAEPATDKTGQALYVAACAICHEADQRAAMVPDLMALGKPTDAAYWKQWIAHGKAGSLMPAFAKADGGPLSDPQIDSLVEYLTSAFQPRAKASSQTAATVHP